jgi:hypothetical protein
MKYLRFWQWIKREKTIELTPIIALPLASPVYPLHEMYELGINPDFSTYTDNN